MQSYSRIVRVLGAVAIAGGLIVGCDKGKASSKETAGALPPGYPSTGELPSSRPAAPPAGATPPHAGAMTAPAAGAMTGTVAETMKAGGYTYARVTVGGQDVWAAGPETALAVGATVDLTGGALMTAFHSDTLDRTFDQIYFLSSWGGAPAGSPHGDLAGGSPHGDLAGGSPHGAPAAAAVPAGEPIEPLDGSQPVAQIFADRAALAGKPVAVHGRVVKFNGGIMGKNWLHVQDGTGAAGTNDLIVTTQDTAAVGEVVLARGTLVLDKDLGAGYRYDVLLEDATLTRR